MLLYDERHNSSVETKNTQQNTSHQTMCMYFIVNPNKKLENTRFIMAQSPGRNLLVDEAHLAVNIAAMKWIYPSYQESGFEIEETIAEIKGFLRRYATARSLYLRQTQKISKLQQNFSDQFGRLVMMGRTLKVADESDIEVENTLNELELFNGGQRDDAPD